MPNPARGEVEITLDGKSYRMRPSFAAIMEFEDRSRMSVFEALRALGERQSAPLRSVAGLFHACIVAGWPRGGGIPPSFEAVADAIYKDGVATHVEAYMRVLGACVTGEKAMEGNGEAPATTAA